MRVGGRMCVNGRDNIVLLGNGFDKSPVSRKKIPLRYYKVLTSYLAAVHWDREQRGHGKLDWEDQVNTFCLGISSACHVDVWSYMVHRGIYKSGAG